MALIPFLLFSFSRLKTSLLSQNCSCTYQVYFTTKTLFYYQCFTTIILVFFKKKVVVVISNSQNANLQHSLKKFKKKKNVQIFFLLLNMFLYPRFNIRNLKDANCFMFLRCITTSKLIICSQHDNR